MDENEDASGTISAEDHLLMTGSAAGGTNVSGKGKEKWIGDKGYLGYPEAIRFSRSRFLLHGMIGWRGCALRAGIADSTAPNVIEHNLEARLARFHEASVSSVAGEAKEIVPLPPRS